MGNFLNWFLLLSKQFYMLVDFFTSGLCVHLQTQRQKKRNKTAAKTRFLLNPNWVKKIKALFSI